MWPLVGPYTHQTCFNLAAVPTHDRSIELQSNQFFCIPQLGLHRTVTAPTSSLAIWSYNPTHDPESPSVSPSQCSRHRFLTCSDGWLWPGSYSCLMPTAQAALKLFVSTSVFTRVTKDTRSQFAARLCSFVTLSCECFPISR